MNPSSIVQLSINGKVVLVPVTTVDSLAIGVESITASASRRLAFGKRLGQRLTLQYRITFQCVPALVQLRSV